MAAVHNVQPHVLNQNTNFVRKPNGSWTFFVV